jgi:Protein of unknown function (DUF2975)
MPIEELRKQARVLMWLVTIPFGALSILAALLIGNVVLQGGRYFDTVALWYLPMALYMLAIWMVRQALKAIADGDLFGEVVPSLLYRVGSLVFAGAIFNEFGRPLITMMIYGHPWIRTFEASGVTLGVLGLTLALIARLLKSAVDMRDELDGFI